MYCSCQQTIFCGIAIDKHVLFLSTNIFLWDSHWQACTVLVNKQCFLQDSYWCNEGIPGTCRKSWPDGSPRQRRNVGQNHWWSGVSGGNHHSGKVWTRLSLGMVVVFWLLLLVAMLLLSLVKVVAVMMVCVFVFWRVGVDCNNELPWSVHMVVIKWMLWRLPAMCVPSRL